MILTGSFTDQYVKRDKGYIVTDAEAQSLHDGRLLCGTGASRSPASTPT